MKEFLEDRTRTSSQTRTPGTRGRIRRRTVYIGTVIAMLAMVGGFALATFTLGTMNAPSQGGNGVTVTGTNYDCATTCISATTTTGSTTPAACANAPAAVVVGGSSPTETISLAVASTGTTCKGGDFAETFSFTSSFAIASAPACFTSSTSCTDTFQVSYTQSTTAANAQLGTASFTESGTAPSGIITVNVIVVVDFQSASPTSTISNLAIAVSGNY